MVLSQRNLSILGAALYACEGTGARTIKNRKQKHYAVEFTNKNPKLIIAFLKFLRLIIGAEEDRIKAELFVYPDHNETSLLKYWSDLTKIPPKRFNQIIHLKQKSIKYKPNPLGTMKIRYTHKEHFLKIQSIINEIFD